MVKEKKSAGVLTVKRRRSRMSPSMMLVGVTKSLCSFSQEMGSCLSLVLDNCLLKVASVGDVKVDVVIDINSMWHW